MFEFLWKRDKEIQSLAEIIAVDMEKLNLSKLAIEKAIMMIAKAIAKSDILIQTESKEKNKQEYRLNIQPNDHECGTVFWTEVVRKLLTIQEALVIPLGGKYYLASAWQVSNNVLTERNYSDITLTCAGYNYSIYKKFRSSEVIHLKYDNARIRLYLQNVVGQYDRTLDAVNAMMRMSSMPRFKLKLGTSALSFREKQADGTDKIMTKDQYVKKIKNLLESDELVVLTESDNVSVNQLQVNTAVKAEELAKTALQINNEVANAFDIPEAVFNGNITEKSDATNEFITYAVGPVAEVINDTLTAYIVGEADYCAKDEKVMVWLARFKHVDVVDSAVNLDKLRGIGFNYDEIREMVGYPLLNTEFSQARALTKNYGEEGNGNAVQET
jgi:HK97 family phage portal protein